MKPIQILILAAAVTVSAAAQSASANGQNTGSSTQPAGTAKPGATPVSSKANAGGKSSPKGASSTQPSAVKLIVPKPSPQTTTAGAKNSSATNSGGAKGPGATAASKSGSQAAASTKTPVAGNKGANGTASLHKSTTVQKVPVLTVKPAQKTPGQAKGAKAATSRKSVAAKAVTPKKSQVTIVPQKTAGGKKPADNTAPTTITASGRRDPFMSVIRNIPSSPAGPNCSVGKRCLFIPELELKGIAKDPDGQMLAVVVSNTHRAYFLRENDQVFNGSVQKITGDSVVFREFATDHLGRETAHEVVKKIPKS